MMKLKELGSVHVSCVLLFVDFLSARSTWKESALHGNTGPATLVQFHHQQAACLWPREVLGGG